MDGGAEDEGPVPLAVDADLEGGDHGPGFGDARMIQLTGFRKAFNQGRDNEYWALDGIETHDCFTIAELIEYEAMGLTKPGQGAVAIKEGWTQKDGKLPVLALYALVVHGYAVFTRQLLSGGNLRY